MAARQRQEMTPQEQLRELDRIAKTLVRRDLELSEVRRQQEEQLIRTQLILANLQDGLFVINEAGKLELFNLAAEQMFEVEAKDLLGRMFQELQGFLTLAPLVRLLEEKKQVFRHEFTMPRNRVIEVTTIPLKVQGQAKGIILVSHDITREKHVEQLKTEFVSLAAHQLRTPLSAVKWSLDTFLSGDAGPLSSEQLDLLAKTRGSNERMITLINDLLDVTRIEEGRYLHRPALSQLEQVAENVVRSFEGQAQQRNITLFFEQPKERIPKVFIDKEKIQFVIQNFIDNALRYSHPGHKVVASIVYDTQDKKALVFSVKDSGIGIPEDQKSRVFEKFFRASNARQMDTEGTGLGLYLSQNIIQAHEGTIGVESKEGQGSTFFFSLPVSEEPGQGFQDVE